MTAPESEHAIALAASISASSGTSGPSATHVSASPHDAYQAAATAFVFLVWLIGRLRDVSGSYRESCFVLVGIALLGSIAVLPPPGRRRPA